MPCRVQSGLDPSNYARLTHGTDAVDSPYIPPYPFSVFVRLNQHVAPGPLGASIIKFDRIPPGFGGNLDYFQCAVFDEGGGNISFGAVASRFSSDDTAPSLADKTLDTPYDLTFVFVSDDERHMIVDGVLEGSDFTHSEAHNGLEGIIIFSSYTSTVGTYNKPIVDACVADLCIIGLALTAEDVAPLTTERLSPADVFIDNVYLYVPKVDAASISDAFDGIATPGILTPVSLTAEPGGGSFTDESDCFPVAAASDDCISSGFDLRYPPCVTTWTQCVKIVRRDGVAFRFTSLDQDVEFRGETYLTCGGLDPSATQTLAQVGEVGSSELGGLITATGVEESELYGGLFDDAFVEIWLVDYEGSERPRRLAAGWAGKITHSTRGYRMEVLGPGARLEQRPIVQVYSPQCRWVFGDERCGVDIEALAVSGTVTSGLNRGVFTATLGTAAASGTGAAASSGELTAQFANGRVRWETGVNAGQVTEVKEVDFETGLITLWALTCNVPESGDTFTLLPGCAQDFATCKDLYDNGDAFGGFPYVPGRDSLQHTPDAKAAG